VRSPFAARVAAGLVRHTRGLDQVLASTGSKVPAASAGRYRTLTASPDHVHATLTLFSQWKPTEVEAFLPRARTPSLLVAGAADAWIPEDDVRRAAELLPAGRMVTLDGLGHLAHEEAPARVDEAMTPFLEEVLGVMRPPPRPAGPPPPPPA
jgi:magnesium chelatase accessory protein